MFDAFAFGRWLSRKGIELKGEQVNLVARYATQGRKACIDYYPDWHLRPNQVQVLAWVAEYLLAKDPAVLAQEQLNRAAQRTREQQRGSNGGRTV